jgi:anthranilate phosphoribosyltransferase
MADFVTLQAAAALHIAGAAADLMAGTRMARDVLASGAARDVLNGYVRLSNEVAE